MKCQICGTKTLPGATLCGPCKAALKRARQETVQDLKPLRKPARRAPKPHLDPAEETSELATLATQALAATVHPARSRAPLALAIIVIAIALLYFGFAGPDARGPADAAPSASESPPRSVAQPPALAVPDVQPGSGAAPTVPTTASAEPIAPASAKPAAEPPRNTPPRTVKAPSPARAPVGSPPSIVSQPAADGITAFGPEPSRAAPPPAPAAPPPQPAPPPPPDRKQLLGEALARCTGDFFTRAACEEGVRMRSCEGLWGQTPQCPSREPVERGQ